MEDRFCKECGKKLNQYHRGRFCYNCQNKMPKHLLGESKSDAKLREFAEFYDFARDKGSLRRFKEHVEGVRQPRVLGINYDHGQFIFHCEFGEMRGPIPDEPTRYLEPPNLGPIDWEICSGLVSGRAYIGFRTSGWTHNWFEFSTEKNYSGAIYQVVPKG